MAVMDICVGRGLLLALFFFAVDARRIGVIAVDQRPRLEPPSEAVEQKSGPLFIVMFPGVIESGSEAELCASLLKPQEKLTMTISLLDEKNVVTQLVQQSSRMAFHRCFSFQAPEVDGESVQTLQVEVKGGAFKVTEESKVMFKCYLPLTFIQTDKPIYNPGQTVNFRIVTMDTKYVPLDQMYSLVVVEDNSNNRIGQWTNVTSRWILELSHQLNPEAQVGMYTLRAFIGERMTSQVFEVKKYVLPKFDVTLNAPQMYSIADVGLTVEACAKYTYGQPVPGQALVEVCRSPDVVFPKLTRQCLNKTTRISVCHFNGTPIANKAVYLLDGNSWPNKMLLNLNTNQKGLATFSLNTANLAKATLNLVASATPGIVSSSSKSAYFATDTRAVQLLQLGSSNNPTISELSIVKLEQPLKCDAVVPVTVKYSFAGESGGYSVDIIYMVLSRGVIVLHGFKKITSRASDTVTSGTVSFQLSVSIDMAPVVQILAFCVLPSENVVAASASFDTEMCFQTQVSLQFSPATAVPGEENTLTVSAQAGSLCGLSAVDQSVRIMEPGRRLSPKMVFDLLPMQSVYPYSVEDKPECISFQPRIRFRPSQSILISEAYTTFKSVGIKIATNIAALALRCQYVPEVFERNEGVAFGMAQAAAQAPDQAPAAIPLKAENAGGKRVLDVTVRTYFPETWIWQLAQVDGTGSTRVPLKVPDTITTWETEAFCLSSKGFGLAPPVQLTVFQPFFLELSLPYSIIRGESFELKATVFNYLSKCIMVKVTPTSSLAFTLKPFNEPYSSCLCANGRKTFKWVFTASVLGPVNVTVNASAESSRTLCGSEVVTVPTRGRIDVVTQSLLVLPEGVERTNSQSWLLCPKGYQGQLKYRHSDGSYSTFGYDESNTWLTTFVMRSFGLARQFIFIDPHVLQSAKDWLISKQGSDGCFIQQGTLYHNEMKGGVGDSVTMTAYIVASLLELGVPITDPVITNALSCLRPVVGNLGNTYAMALLAYTFSLAGETSTRAQLLTTLNNRAISEGNKLHWSQTSSGDTLAVEISSYVLLAVLFVQPLTTTDLGYANRIVNWLVTQQNPYGGFTSTQDTVVALHALSLYAAEVFSLEGSSTVTVQSSSVAEEVYSFDVNRDNRLLYQEKPLKNIPGKYSFEVKGSTCVSMQVACFYNIQTPVIVARTLSVEVKVTGDCKGANIMVNFTVKYNGPKASTNMVLVDIKLLSGFTADTSLLGSLPNSFDPIVERVDAGDDNVLVYLKEVPKGVPMTYSLLLKQILAVKNLKPAVISVYDYYQPSDAFETTYMSPCP
ncbi:hypothetical protein cypCar_00039352 [Cyprinus carpio]|nr:hypothetical protein cypCar_00039352 [Cyprinus carpio]